MTIAKRTGLLLLSLVIAISGYMVFSSMEPVQSHSGGLDAYGGHHCWTSCGSYGMEYGEYRCHRDTARCHRSNRRHHRTVTNSGPVGSGLALLHRSDHGGRERR